MSVTLKPIRADLYLFFQCPNCGAEHMVGYKETQFPGGALCYCGQKLQWARVNGARVNLLYADASPIGPKKENHSAQSPIPQAPLEGVFADAIEALVSLKVPKRQAVVTVEGLFRVRTYDCVEDVIRDAFQAPAAGGPGRPSRAG